MKIDTDEAMKPRSAPDIEDAKEELAGLIFQCARYQRPSTDWKAALDKFCETYLAKKPAECEPVAIVAAHYQESKYGTDIEKFLDIDLIGDMPVEGTKLFTKPQPCPDCFSLEHDRDLLENEIKELQAKVEQFDRAISRIGHHVGAVCAGVDTEDECGAGGHTAVAIIGKFDELQSKVADSTYMHETLSDTLTRAEAVI